jgi:predicted O-methyltransferase YrrM
VQGAAEAAQALADWAGEACGADEWVLLVGSDGPLSTAVEQLLEKRGLEFRRAQADALPAWTMPAEGLPAIILCAYGDARRTTQVAIVLADHSELQDVRFEYISGLEPERSRFRELDEYRDTWFVSPLLLETRSPYDIYEESLQHFEQKCGLRDYLDLYQALSHVVRAGIDGDIAEFGSYRGHSGYLIARTLDALASDKRLFMFDTFESFPDERYGVDRFWSRTHDVDFEIVRRKFESIGRVTLVKGDFTETLATSDIDRLALAYIDCDSYRATTFLIDALMPEKIAPGGLLVCEDYGHPALLGNRVAVEQTLKRHSVVFRWFSQFSGLYVIAKPGPAPEE